MVLIGLFLYKLVTDLIFILGYRIMAVHKILVLVVAVRICLAQQKLMRTVNDTGYRFSNCMYTYNEVIGEELRNQRMLMNILTLPE